MATHDGWFAAEMRIAGALVAILSNFRATWAGRARGGVEATFVVYENADNVHLRRSSPGVTDLGLADAAPASGLDFFVQKCFLRKATDRIHVPNLNTCH